MRTLKLSLYTYVLLISDRENIQTIDRIRKLVGIMGALNLSAIHMHLYGRSSTIEFVVHIKRREIGRK